MNQDERREYLIRGLLKENDKYSSIKIPKEIEEQKLLLRGLMNIRKPSAIDSTFLRVQDEYLKEEILEKGIVDVKEIHVIRNGMSIWQGDITTLKCDAIVNAANSGMTGCYVPNHKCIDNCIHTYAGIELRNVCDAMMEEQGHEEKTGKAKLTKAYNLPCQYILHTVGPIIYRMVTKKDEELLASCYRSCLELASKNHIESIAFCCISTGEFHFPNRRAAEIAISEVEKFMRKDTCVKKVVFNVFKEIDKEIYGQLLRKN